MDDVDIRVWALDRAIKEAPTGTPWEGVFALAAKYTRYLARGTYDTPVADAEKKAAEEAEKAAKEEHGFASDRRRPAACSICGQLYGEGNHK